MALGRDNVVHLALTDSAAAERLSVVLERLVLFMGRSPETGTEDETGRVAPIAMGSAVSDRTTH